MFYPDVALSASQAAGRVFVHGASGAVGLATVMLASLSWNGGGGGDPMVP